MTNTEEMKNDDTENKKERKRAKKIIKERSNRIDWHGGAVEFGEKEIIEMMMEFASDIPSASYDRLKDPEHFTRLFNKIGKPTEDDIWKILQDVVDATTHEINTLGNGINLLPFVDRIQSLPNERNKGIDDCVQKLKDLERPRCLDHTPYRGACVSCGSTHNPDIMPDLEDIIPELEMLKSINVPGEKEELESKLKQPTANTLSKDKVLEILVMELGINKPLDIPHITGVKEAVDKICSLSVPAVSDSDVDFRKDIANELTRGELIDRLCELQAVYTDLREKYLFPTEPKEGEKE